ncbi:hypothetical protein [Cupriavidus plantarum]|uniref:hypothetical protein n=1 Tax=Cupriavidus plantarum TaxID=942865 RepID=UPI000EB58F6F|nr:hypothetical protein [Cupriavidus plantarum]RLK44974.1 hypothetical protein C7417_0977 [Cupriavidus plantarum]
MSAPKTNDQMMKDLRQLLSRMADSVNAAGAHYQIWFTLRGEGKALSEYHQDMSDYRYVDFFMQAMPVTTN